MDSLKMYEGKAKVLYSTGDDDVLLMKFKDKVIYQETDYVDRLQEQVLLEVQERQYKKQN